MSGRSARRARQAAEPAEARRVAVLNPELVPPSLPFRKVADVPAGMCWICGETDHQAFLDEARSRGGFLHEPQVANAMHHVVMAAFGPIGSRLDVQSPEWEAAYKAMATAAGYLTAATSHFARADEFNRVAESATAAATQDAIEAFFDEIIRRGGEGVYQLELRRNKPITPVRIH